MITFVKALFNWFYTQNYEIFILLKMLFIKM